VNFADTLYVSCGAYSSIHPNRAAALNHLFLVIGNGYDWIEGQLVDTCEGADFTKLTASEAIAHIFDRRRQRHEAEKRWEAEQKRKVHEKPKATKEQKAEDDKFLALIDEMFAARKKMQEEDPEKYAKLRAKEEAEHQELLAKMAEDKKWQYRVPDNIDERLRDTNYNTWYPGCMEYSYLVNFPDDIQPDWLEGIIETAKLVLAQRGTTSAYKDHPGATEKCIAKNEEMARLALDKAYALLHKQER
jgi:hypothetical protein